MTGLSHSEFRPAQQVILCKSLDGRTLQKGDIVYTLNNTTLQTYTVDMLLGDSRIQISLVNAPPNQTVKETLPSHKVIYNIMAYLATKIAQIKYQIEIELPDKYQELLTIANKINPQYDLNIEVGDNKENMEI